MVAITLIFLAEATLAAVLAGFFGSLFGIGSGVIVVPFLTVFLGFPIHEAIAVSAVSVIATSNAGGSAYVEQRLTNVRLAMFLEVATTAGALVGSVVALLLNSWVLFTLFGVLLASMAFSALHSRGTDERKIANHGFESIHQDRLSRYLGLQGTYFDAAEKKEVRYLVTGSVIGCVISAFAGIISGLLGLGGGVFKVAGMSIFMNLPMKVAIATSKFMIGVTAAAGAVVFLVVGLVDVYVVAPVALGTILGATFGIFLMNRLRSSVIKVTFGLLMILLSYTMFAQSLSMGFGHLP